ncbi:helix-turn-helix domain-containing protein [Longispora sp. NPDC051575]|uniref:helix-turn-helix domain-containing protein n=1 Tax=Longispora sp. NPDC051575 TaxID=3154943 RepID=UPI00344A4E1D
MANTFRESLREFRNRAEITQEDLALRSGVSVRTIRGIERGERTNPRADTARQLADALHLSADERREFFALAAGPELVDPAGDGPAVPPRPAVPRQARQPDHLALAAEELATGVGIRLRREYEHQQMHDPFPLPVRWTRVHGEVSDHLDNIDAPTTGDRANQVDLVGDFSEITELYRRLPTGRLVVLGPAGSGKTMLATRMTLSLLEDRERAHPVPVTVNVASWDPTRTRFRDWLSGSLIRDYPGLARTTPGGLTLSATLVGTDAILPVLDGFDEIAPGLRGPALRALNRAKLPIVLTSRPAEYDEAVSLADVLTAAAVIRLDTLTPGDVAHYLPRATRRNLGSAPGVDARTVWYPVISEMTAEGPGYAGGNVATALRTPLMVSLARAVYSDTPGRDPADLLDTGRFPESTDIEEHLLASYVPTMYTDRPATGAHRDFGLDHVLRWLNYLARHGTTRHESGIAWWGLGSTVPIWARAVLVGLVCTVTVALTVILVGVPLSLIAYGATEESFTKAVSLQSVSGLLNGVGAGVPLGLLYGLVHRFRGPTPVPSRVRLRLGRGRHPGAIPLSQVRTRMATAFAGGLALGAAMGLVIEAVTRTALVPILQATAAFGGVFAVAAAVAVGFVSWFESPADADAAASPVDSLKANRDAVLTQMLMGGLTFGLVVAVGTYAVEDVTLPVLRILASRLTNGEFSYSGDPTHGAGTGIVSGIVAAFAYAMILTAWGQWLILARLWLPLTGRLPWRLLTFMEDAYDRGVLRRSGPVWEFRHERLQHHHAQTGPEPAGNHSHDPPVGA